VSEEDGDVVAVEGDVVARGVLCVHRRKVERYEIGEAVCGEDDFAAARCGDGEVPDRVGGGIGGGQPCGPLAHVTQGDEIERIVLLGLAIRELVVPGLLTLPELLARMSTLPARVFNLPGGTLAVGAPADLVMLDPDVRWTVRREEMFSKSRNSPFLGEELVGRALLTVVGGEVVFEHGG
jgi:hypothetical protein